MKSSQYLITTQKEQPSDAQVISHQLMIRAGFVSSIASGIYSWLPLGLKVLQKTQAIVRDEMNKAGAIELLMPMVQPAELWQKSKRWHKYGPELLRFKDRNKRDFCLGPTHEEVIANIASQFIRSYKKLPINLYQIQTKFRDEIRPRFGVMRAREFIMKDAYSFHISEASLDETYQRMYNTYCNIFDRIGLNYCSVIADSGSIGGSHSHEFHALTNSGEDAIAVSDQGDYAANVEQATTRPVGQPKAAQQPLTLIETPGKKTINAVANYLGIAAQNSIKVLLVEGQNSELVALALRGDHTLNETKAVKHPLVKSPLTFANEQAMEQAMGCGKGFYGVVNLSLPLLVDFAAYALSDFVCGANQNDQHYSGVNWQRDVGRVEQADLRAIVDGDDSPDGKGKITIKRGIEVGHIFKLGTTYSENLNAHVMSEQGGAKPMLMGCYGIGISRLVAAVIEQHFDDAGMLLPPTIAPFDVVIVPINYHKSNRVRQLTEQLYQALLAAQFDVLLDDRKERAGILFADADLIGIPHRLVLNDSHIDSGKIEYKNRLGNKQEIDFATTVDFMAQAIKQSQP